MELADLDQIIDAINNGKVNAKQVDWENLVLDSYQATQAKTPIPFIVFLAGLLSEIHVRDWRIEALNRISENLDSYLANVCNDKETIDRFAKECGSLRHYFRTVNYIIPYYDDAGIIYNENKDKEQFEVEAFIYLKFLERLDNISEYLAYTQAHYDLITNKSKYPFLPQQAPILASLYFGIIIPEDIIGFCQSLYMAEFTRQRYLNGWKPSPITTIDTFPLDLRNNCFDAYIKLRTNSKMSELMQDNNRLYRPTELECMNILLEDEWQAYNRLKGIENFKSSLAYSEIWKPGTPDILRMAELFLTYLQDNMNLLQNSQLVNITNNVTAFPYCTYIVTDTDKTRDEIEADIVRAAKKSAQTFANLLTNYKLKGFLDFRGETPKEIYEYMKERYNLTYSAANFTRYFKG